MDTPIRPRRADARLAKERILAAAVSTLGSDPSASLERVAKVAGVHRATVYRHFPSREHLMHAVVDRALSDGRDVVEQTARLRPHGRAVYRLASATVQFGDRYSFLIGTPEIAAAGPDPIGLSALMKTLQSERVLRNDVSATWLAAAFIALAQALMTPGATLPQARADEMLAEMFLGGASAD